MFPIIENMHAFWSKFAPFLAIIFVNCVEELSDGDSASIIQSSDRQAVRFTKVWLI